MTASIQNNEVCFYLCSIPNKIGSGCKNLLTNIWDIAEKAFELIKKNYARIAYFSAVMIIGQMANSFIIVSTGANPLTVVFAVGVAQGILLEAGYKYI